MRYKKRSDTRKEYHFRFILHFVLQKQELPVRYKKCYLQLSALFAFLLLLEALREAFCALFLFCCLSMLLALFALLALL